MTLCGSSRHSAPIPGIVPIQRRAYRWICESVMDLFHVAFVELRHRGYCVVSNREVLPSPSLWSRTTRMSFHCSRSLTSCP